MAQGGGDDLANRAELSRPESSSGECRSSDSQAGGDHGGPGIERDGVTVDGDSNRVEAILGLLTVVFSLVIGIFFVLGIGSDLPDLNAIFGFIGAGLDQ